MSLGQQFEQDIEVLGQGIGVTDMGGRIGNAQRAGIETRQRLAQGGAQRRDIAFELEAGLVRQDFCRPHGAGKDGRRATQDGFRPDQSEGFVMRGEDHGICGAVQRRHVVAETEIDDARGIERRVANDDQANSRVAFGERLEDQIGAFEWVIVGGKEQQQLIVGDADGPACRGAVLACREGEFFGIYRRIEGGDLVRIDLVQALNFSGHLARVSNDSPGLVVEGCFTGDGRPVKKARALLASVEQMPEMGSSDDTELSAGGARYRNAGPVHPALGKGTILENIVVES